MYAIPLHWMQVNMHNLSGGTFDSQDPVRENPRIELGQNFTIAA